MKLNTDLSRRVRVDSASLEWTPSPDGSVLRRMLARDGEEVAVATSIVRYPEGSRFPRHEHPLGEEYLVLAGVFQDESGDYPVGTYVRNPPGSGHSPFSDGGCDIFVKLRQMDPGDRHPVVVSTDASTWVAVEGRRELPLHADERERVTMIDIEPGGRLGPLDDPGGTEILVIHGECRDGEETLGEHAWLRLPPGHGATLVSDAGCRLFVKTGHLAHGGL